MPAPNVVTVLIYFQAISLPKTDDIPRTCLFVQLAENSPSALTGMPPVLVNRVGCLSLSQDLRKEARAGAPTAQIESRTPRGNLVLRVIGCSQSSTAVSNAGVSISEDFLRSLTRT